MRYQITIAKLPLAKDMDDFAFAGTPINETLMRDFTGRSGGFLARRRFYGFVWAAWAWQDAACHCRCARLHLRRRPRPVLRRGGPVELAGGGSAASAARAGWWIAFAGALLGAG